MRTIHSAIGMTFAITPSKDCSVTTPDGRILLSCGTGRQTLFCTPVADFCVDDDQAWVTPCSMKHAWSGGASQADPNYTSKMLLSADGTHLVFNFDDNDGPNLLGRLVCFGKVTHVSGSLGGITELYQTFLDVGTLTSMDLDFTNIKIMRDICRNTNIGPSVDWTLPSCVTVGSIFQNVGFLQTCRLILPVCTTFPNDVFRSCRALETAILYLPSVSKLDFTEYMVSDVFTHLLFETGDDGTSGLASCTTLLLKSDFHSKLTPESIQNIVDSLPDWSDSGKSATCQFPTGKLTQAQQETLAAKGWTYTEA